MRKKPEQLEYSFFDYPSHVIEQALIFLKHNKVCQNRIKKLLRFRLHSAKA